MSDRTGAATVVGAGVVSPAGSTVDDAWSVVRHGASTLAEVMEHPELPDLPILACCAAGFTPEDIMQRHELRRFDRVHQMSFWAADQALADAGSGPAPDRCAVIVGGGLGVELFQTEQLRAFLDRGFRGVSPLAIPTGMANSIAAQLSMRYGYLGPSFTINTACASSTNALGEALWLLRSGRADRVLVGGVDAAHSARIHGSFTRMEAMSRRIDDPTTASRPFDGDRDGFVLGEGAAFVVLERTVDSPTGLGKIIGYGTTSDAHHIVAPSPGGAGAIAAMRAALADAGIEPDDVGHVNAHGTSTQLNDQTEAEAIAEVFGRRSLAVTSTKGVVGHLIGAAGSFEAVMTLCSISANEVPPTANSTRPDESIAELIDVPSTAITPRSSVAISNSFGFGGHNATLVLAP